jgi:hypothetical protein
MRWYRALLSVSLFAATLLAWNVTTARADGDVIHNGPAFLAVAVDTQDFELPLDEGGIPTGGGTVTIFAQIGTFIATDDVAGTTFDSAALSTIRLPNGLDITSLYGHAATVFGTVHTLPPPPGTPGAPHLITPVPDEIPPEIQAAVHASGVAPLGTGGLSDLLGDAVTPLFPTTYEIAHAIALFMLPPLEEGEDIGPRVQQVAQALFAGDDVLRPTSDGLTLSVTSEGEMFPHDPSGSILLFSFTFDEEGGYSEAIGTPIPIDVKPGSDTNPINLKKKGQLPIALLTDGDFDAADIDPDSVTCGGVPADKTSLEDVDGDGDQDLICHWDVPTLVDAGLTVDVDDLFVVAEADGETVVGHDEVDTFSKK